MGERGVRNLPSVSGAQTVLVLLADIDARARLWGYARFVIGVRALRHEPGLSFAKVLGSGHEGGFGLRPSVSRQGLLCVFDDADHATEFVERSPVARAYRDHAREFLSVHLRAFSSRGSWSGTRFPVTVAAPADGAIAGLTRASIKPHLAPKFWRRAPPAERALA
ncbi:MAG: spheroidene monooxygenase, partial [Proteobacteria bacterium]|nr:spheroidene monooxygenase [Burkholderiales bacterium]